MRGNPLLPHFPEACSGAGAWGPCAPAPAPGLWRLFVSLATGRGNPRSRARGGPGNRAHRRTQPHAQPPTRRPCVSTARRPRLGAGGGAGRGRGAGPEAPGPFAAPSPSRGPAPLRPPASPTSSRGGARGRGLCGERGGRGRCGIFVGLALVWCACGCTVHCRVYFDGSGSLRLKGGTTTWAQFAGGGGKGVVWNVGKELGAVPGSCFWIGLLGVQ